MDSHANFSSKLLSFCSPHSSISTCSVDLRRVLLSSFSYGLNSVHPSSLLQSALKKEGNKLVPQDTKLNSVCPQMISSKTKILILGAGKATLLMALSLVSLLESLSPLPPFTGLINVPYGQLLPASSAFVEYKETDASSILFNNAISVNFASHPVPDINGLNGARNMLKLVDLMKAELTSINQKEGADQLLVIFLISGGGSSLLPLPSGDVTLDELKEVTTLLLKSGACINKINTLRKHLSKIQGGNLARHIYPLNSLTLVISDVIGDDMGTIASGPTTPDSTTFQEAISYLNQLSLFTYLPKSAQEVLQNGAEGVIEETPKPGDKVFENCKTILIGGAKNMSEKMKESLLETGMFFSCEVFSSEISGEASLYGKKLMSMIEEKSKEVVQRGETELTNQKKGIALIATGEFTVTIKGKGVGGRNQEMLLSFLLELQKLKRTRKENHQKLYFDEVDYVIISAAADGLEGNSPAMGAIVDSASLERFVHSQKDKLVNQTEIEQIIQHELDNNNSYTVFSSLGDALVIGQTGTNVNDLLAIIILPK